MHTGVGNFSEEKAKPESVIYYNNTNSVDILDQWAYSFKGGMRRWPVAVFYNILDLAGINARILFKEHQQQESPEESPAATGRGAEGRIQLTRTWRQCQSERATNRTRRRTLEMPQARVLQLFEESGGNMGRL